MPPVRSQKLVIQLL